MLFKQELAALAINASDRAGVIRQKINSANLLLETLASDIDAELARSKKLKIYFDDVAHGKDFATLRLVLEEKEVTDILNAYALLEYAEALIRARFLLRHQLRSRTHGQG
jgi:hypothetical protein